jgi:F420-non-reducing hydrogenase large subunit
MKADGTYVDLRATDYLDYLGEHVEPWGYGKMPYAKSWNEGF